MKTKKKSRTGNVLKHIFNVRAWSDYDRTRAGWLYLKQGLKRLLVIQSHDATQSFEAVMTKMNLTEDDLAKRAASLLRLSFFMAMFASLILLYVIYQLI